MLNFVSRIWLIVSSLLFCVVSVGQAVEKDPVFSIVQVDKQYIDWKSRDTVKLMEYNPARKPILRSYRAGMSCRVGSRGSWAPLPVELTFPEPVTSQPRLYVECRTPEKGWEVLHVHFDVFKSLVGFAIEGRSVLDADVLAAPTGGLLQLGPDGKLKFFRAVDSVGKGNAEDFKQHRVNGKIYYSYLTQSVYAPQVTSGGYRTILNSRYEPIETTDFLTDLHEFEYLGKNHYLYVTYEVKDRVDGSCYIEQAVIERKDGRILHRFELGAFLRDRAVFPSEGEPVAFYGRSCVQLAHINSVQVIGPQTWFIGFGRGAAIAWNFVKNKLEWAIGNSALPGIKSVSGFGNFHTPRFSKHDSRFVMFENSSPLSDGTSTVVTIFDFKLDLAALKIASVKTLEIAGLRSVHSGNVEARGSVYSIGTGSREKGDWDFMEYDGTRRTFAIRFTTAARSYRVYRSL